MGFERKKLYWRFQVIAWTAWSMNEMLLYINQFGWKLEWLFSALINILLGIGLTHYYRLLNEKYQWQSKRKIPLSEIELTAIVLISAIFMAVNLWIDYSILDGQTNQKLNTFILLQFFLNFSKPVTIWFLIYFFYKYAQKQLMIERKNDQLEIAVQESEGRILRAQMNPHFVFNALNSIRALILEDPKKARNGINQLSQLLRNSLLTERKKTIPLAEEMDTIKNYLELEKIRYEERLSFEFDIDEECQQAKIPPMIIQTLVENGIKHGISKEVSGGTIKVTGKKEHEILHIIVQNPGQLSPEKSTNGTGLGIENSKHRLTLLYGEQARIELLSTEHHSVEAHLKIPFLISN